MSSQRAKCQKCGKVDCVCKDRSQRQNYAHFPSKSPSVIPSNKSDGTKKSTNGSFYPSLKDYGLKKSKHSQQATYVSLYAGDQTTIARPISRPGSLHASKTSVSYKPPSGSQGGSRAGMAGMAGIFGGVGGVGAQNFPQLPFNMSQAPFPSQFKSPSQFESPSQRPSSSQRTSSQSQKSLLKTAYDQKMSHLQTSRSTMKPGSSQALAQDSWARSQLALNPTSNCPVGLTWIRDKDGYRCLGGRHFVSDELLKEGKGGWYSGGINIDVGCDGKMDWLKCEWKGPFYGEDEDWVGVSEEEKRKVRIDVFGKEDPGQEDVKWVSIPRKG